MALQPTHSLSCMTAWCNHSSAESCDICRYNFYQPEFLPTPFPNRLGPYPYPPAASQTLPLFPAIHSDGFQAMETDQATRNLLPTYSPPSHPPPSASAPTSQPPSLSEFQTEIQSVAHRCYPDYSEESIRLRGLLTTCLNSQWYLEQQPEPHGALDGFAHKISETQFACSVPGCGESRTRLDRLINHFRVHINHRPYDCFLNGGCHNPECILRFCTPETLRAHLRIPERRRACSNCEQSMDSKNLPRHRESKRCRASGLSSQGIARVQNPPGSSNGAEGFFLQ